jgi:hypothetical protein
MFLFLFIQFALSFVGWFCVVKCLYLGCSRIRTVTLARYVNQDCHHRGPVRTSLLATVIEGGALDSNPSSDLMVNKLESHGRPGKPVKKTFQNSETS